MKRATSRPPIRQPRGSYSSQQPPASPFRSHLPPPVERRRLESADLGKRVVAVAAVALLAGWIIATYAYRANRAASRSLDAASQTAQSFAADLAKNDYWAASAQLSPTAQRLHPPTAIKQDLGVLEHQYGAIIHAQAASTTPRSVGGLQTCRVEYWLTFEHGFAPLHIVLVRGYRRWSVESYSFG